MKAVCINSSHLVFISHKSVAHQICLINEVKHFPGINWVASKTLKIGAIKEIIEKKKKMFPYWSALDWAEYEERTSIERKKKKQEIVHNFSN